MKERCPCCQTTVTYGLIYYIPNSNARCCYDCLPDDERNAFDEVFGGRICTTSGTLGALADNASGSAVAKSTGASSSKE